MINKKLESLENIQRSIIVERKNYSFLDLYEKMKVLNSKREFECQEYEIIVVIPSQLVS